METLLNEYRKTVVLLLLLLCNAASSFAQNNEGKTYLSNEVDINGLIFKIDPRIELLYVVGYLADYPFMNGLDIRYKEEIENYFSSYKDHEVISFWKEIGPKGFALDAPVFLLIRQTEDLEKMGRTPEGSIESAGGEDWSIFYDGANEGFYSLAVYGCNLYAGQCYGAGKGDIYVFDGSNWSVSYDGSQENIYNMVVYDGNLYAGQGNGEGDGDVLVFDGSTWSTSYDGSRPYIFGMAVYNGKLYAGQGNAAGDGDVLVFDGSTWSTSYDGSQSELRGLAVYGGKLYAGQGTIGSAGAGDVLVFDGSNWSVSYDGSQEMIFGMAVYNGKLYAGQGYDAGDGDVLVFDGSTWSISYDGSKRGIYDFEVYNNKLYAVQGREVGDGDILVFDGSTWSISYDGSRRMFRSLEPYKGKLYAAQASDQAGETDADIYVLEDSLGSQLTNHDKFIRLLKEFAEKSNFKSFFNNHKDFYSLILKNIEFNFKDYDAVQRIENYFGQKQKSYTVIINLLGSGNFAPRVESSSGLEIYCVMEPQSCCGNIPSFTNLLEFDNIVWHEFSHSFVNPLVDEYKEEVNKYSHLLEPIKSSMRNQGYSNWNTTVKEHIVRAVTIRLAANKYGEELSSLTYYRLEMGSRFIYVKHLCEKLREYEANRDKYHSFKEFFPELISVFKNISGEDINNLQNCVEEYRKPDVQIIPNPMDGYDHATTVIIKPTSEKDMSGQQKLYDFIDKYKSWFYSESRIVTDKQAMELDLSKYDMIVFGTPEGNLVLDKYLDQIPLAINRNRVTANRTYEGDDYQLITGWINPLNKNRKMTIYTAQNIEMLNNINQVSLGDSNYVIAKNYKPVKYGNYKRIMKVWICE